MLAFFGIVLLVYGAMHFYALRKVWLAFPHSLALGLALVCWAAAMISAPFFAGFLGQQHWHVATLAVSWVAYAWMGFLFLFCVVFLALDLGSALAALLGSRWQPSDAMALRSVTVIAALLFGYGFFEARQIHVERLTIQTPKLSRAVGQITIVQISDLHLGIMQNEEFLRRVMDKLCAIRPDIVVATGDIVDGRGDDLDRLAEAFHACKPPKGAFAITGNHEYYAGLTTSLRFLHNAGFTVQHGESATVDGVAFVGIDDPGHLVRGHEARLNERTALAAAPKDAFTILLRHQPVVDEDTPFDLQLSGHIHGGQIFPFNFATRLVYGVNAGLTRLASGRWLYVSRGTGTWGPPIRLFASPEITLIKIQAGPRQSISVE